MNRLLQQFLLELPERKKESLLQELKADGSTSYLEIKQLFDERENLKSNINGR
jgi:hypothetical protein